MSTKATSSFMTLSSAYRQIDEDHHEFAVFVRDLPEPVLFAVVLGPLDDERRERLSRAALALALEALPELDS